MVRRFLTLAFFSIHVRCAHGYDDAAGLLQKSQRKKGKDRCESWCQNHRDKWNAPTSWSVRCKLDENACSGCDSCPSQPSNSKNRCESWCQDHRWPNGGISQWAARCQWDFVTDLGSCYGCNECAPFRGPQLKFGLPLPQDSKEGDEYTRTDGSTWVFRNGQWDPKGGTWKPGDKCEGWCKSHAAPWDKKCTWDQRKCGACLPCTSKAEESKARLDLKQQELDRENAVRIKNEKDEGGCRKCPLTATVVEATRQGVDSWKNCERLESANECDAAGNGKCSKKCVGPWGHVWRSKMVPNWRTTTHELEEEQYLSWERIGDDYCCWPVVADSDGKESACPKCTCGLATPWPFSGCKFDCGAKCGDTCCYAR